MSSAKLCAQNNALDAEEAVDYLRGAYKEYQRKPLGPFGVMVARAIAIIQEQGGVTKPELRLQVQCMLAGTSAGPWMQDMLRALPVGKQVLMSTRYLCRPWSSGMAYECSR